MSTYQIPRIVYVGDRAALAVTLENPPASGAVFSGEAFSLPDLVIHRIELERQEDGGRLLIDFTAYAPGFLELPPFEIGGIAFEGLGVEITSILGSGEAAAALSPPAPPLAVPGTGLMIYGTAAGIILIVLAVLWVLFRAPRRLERWLKNRRRKRLIYLLGRLERRLRKTLIRGNTTAPQRGELLNFLTGEFRVFLSFFIGENCRAMTAGELSRLSPAEGPLTDGGFLGPFFRRCDDLRFSGADIGTGELLEILGELRRFVESLNALPPPGPPGGGEPETPMETPPAALAAGPETGGLP
jgi:hypothetical protein